MVLIDVLLTNTNVMVSKTAMTGQTSFLRAALTVPHQASLPVEMVSSVFLQIITVTVFLAALTVVMRVMSGQDVTTVIRLDMFHVLASLISVFSLLVTPQTNTLDNKPNYDKGRGICLLSLVNTTNIYFGGQKEYTSPLSESNYLDSIL